KPWLINNDCVPGPCTGLPGPFYFTPATYGIVPGATFIGTQVTFTEVDDRAGTDPAPNQFYALDPPQPNLCPSNSALQCNNIGTGPPGIFYHDNIACANTAFQY